MALSDLPKNHNDLDPITEPPTAEELMRFVRWLRAVGVRVCAKHGETPDGDSRYRYLYSDEVQQVIDTYINRSYKNDPPRPLIDPTEDIADLLSETSAQS